MKITHDDLKITSDDANKYIVNRTAGLQTAVRETHKKQNYLSELVIKTMN